MQVMDSIKKIVCFNTCSGGIFLTVNNALAPYQVHWSDGNTTQNRTNLCPGIYKVTIQGCQWLLAIPVCILFLFQQALACNCNQRMQCVTAQRPVPLTQQLPGAITHILINWSNGASTPNSNKCSSRRIFAHS